MIKLIQNVRLLERKAMLKQRLEASVAKDLYQVFNRGTAIQKLRNMAGLILKAMGTGDDVSFRRAVTAEDKLGVYKKIKPNQSDFVLYSSSQLYLSRLDATDCADIIRLSGEWVEKEGLAVPGFSGVGNTDWQQNQPIGNTIKEAYRPGVGTGNNKSQVENVWSDGKGRFKNVPGKNRNRGAGRPIEGYVKDLMRDSKAFSGMKDKRLWGDSNVLKLDRLFGLLEACDISGTTTDTVFALEVYGSQVGLTAGYYLLPFGTIVHNMHHSIIEVATALTLNKCIDYRIGFFSTLLPLAAGGLPPELNSIPGILNIADAVMIGQQLHFLNYFEGVNLRGAYLFTDGHVDQFKRSELSHSTKMLGKVRTQVRFPYPTRDEVEKLIHQCIPRARLG